MIDHDALHALLYLRAGKGGEITISQTQLARELVTSKLVVHRTLQRMIEEGRMRQVSGSGPVTRRYEIVARDVWLAAQQSPPTPSSPAP